MIYAAIKITKYPIILIGVVITLGATCDIEMINIRPHTAIGIDHTNTGSLSHFNHVGIFIIDTP